MPAADSVLMVDDDVALCEMVVKYLIEDGLDAQAVNSGERALAALERQSFDVMVLDVMMPGMSGHDVLRQLQADGAGVSPIPVLMLTAKGDDVDRIIGLETGADDYLPKPCNLRELAARLRAILRRSARPAERRRATVAALNAAGIELDYGRREVRVAGRPVNLTSAEFAVLKSLMENVGTPVSKDTLVKTALGRDYVPYDRSIDVHVANLRKKLRAGSDSESPIKTVRGAGYQLIDSNG